MAITPRITPYLINDALVSTYKTYPLKDCIVIHSVADAKGEKCTARFIWQTR